VNASNLLCSDPMFYLLKMTTKSKMISRDAKRRIEVITKKNSDLQELGVPCLF